MSDLDVRLFEQSDLEEVLLLLTGKHKKRNEMLSFRNNMLTGTSKVSLTDAWSIILEGKCIGIILTRRNKNKLTIAFGMNYKYEGKGYMTQALKKFIMKFKNIYKDEDITVLMEDVETKPVKKIARSLGMKKKRLFYMLKIKEFKG